MTIKKSEKKISDGKTAVKKKVTSPKKEISKAVAAKPKKVKVVKPATVSVSRSKIKSVSGVTPQKEKKPRVAKKVVVPPPTIAKIEVVPVPAKVVPPVVLPQAKVIPSQIRVVPPVIPSQAKAASPIVTPPQKLADSPAVAVSAGAQVAPKAPEKIIEISIPVVLKDLASLLQVAPAFIIKKLLENKIIANINQPLDEEAASKIAAGFGYQVKRKPTQEELLFKEHEETDASKLKPRSPIVTFMGHVDHGKTSLLDAIRKSKVADKEYGGITQHIGAYSVALPKGKITFLDTPGHEAFTAMRARGAKVTDIVVLVVAADDGVMPQTVEAIDHAREAGVPIIVAINKIDKPQANIDIIKKELGKLDLTAEDWGGKTIVVGVSAKTGQGIDELLEMLLLEAEMLELKADPLKRAKGVVLESKIYEGKGISATLLVEDGTLYPQDIIIAGPLIAKIKAMFNETGKPVVSAPPASAVEVLGFSGCPAAGEQFFALADEKKAKELAQKRKEELRERELKPIKMISLEEFSAQVKEGKVRELKFILKTDVGGSLEAINESLRKLENTEVKLKIIHQGIGGINVSDVILAEASGAVILGFHVTCDDRSKAEAEKNGIDIRTYNVIYELYNDLKSALEGMLAPKLKKIFVGRLNVRQVFKLSKGGIISGCYVDKGKITRANKVSVLRNGDVIWEGALHSLKRFKDDVREVTEGLECGVSLAGFTDTMPGDVIEVYNIEKIARTL